MLGKENWYFYTRHSNNNDRSFMCIIEDSWTVYKTHSIYFIIITSINKGYTIPTICLDPVCE